MRIKNTLFSQPITFNILCTLVCLNIWSLSLSYSLETRTILVQNYMTTIENQNMSCSMPFSWRIKNYLEELLVHALQQEGNWPSTAGMSILYWWLFAFYTIYMTLRPNTTRVSWVLSEDATWTIHWESRFGDADRVFSPLPSGFHQYDNERDMSGRSTGYFFCSTQKHLYSRLHLYEGRACMY